MTLADLLIFVKSKEIGKLLSLMQTVKDGYFVEHAFRNAISQVTHAPLESVHLRDYKEYHVRQHEVYNNNGARKDKVIMKPFINEEGIEVPGAETVEKIVPVNRIGIAEQQRITLSHAAFLGTPEYQANPQKGIETDFFTAFKRIIDDAKIDIRFKTFVKRVKSEREAAMVWYPEDTNDENFWSGTKIKSKKRWRMKLISPSSGDSLYPVFDGPSNLIAFVHCYKENVVDDVLLDVRQQEHVDIYTADTIYTLIKDEKDWVFTSIVPVDSGADTAIGEVIGFKNSAKKIPVIYAAIPCTAWHIVQSAIERIENAISNLGDANDYFASPIVFLEGEVQGFADKGESGKLLQGTAGAKASYLTWDQAPESTKTELEYLIKFINKYTHTPDVSFDNVKGLGVLSGIALQMFFMDAHLQAADDEEIFGEAAKRTVNLIKAIITVLDPSLAAGSVLFIKAVFKYFLPRNIVEEVTTLIAAVKGGILSRQSAVRLCPFVKDPEAELLLLQGEETQSQANAIALAVATKPALLPGKNGAQPPKETPPVNAN